MSYILNIHPIPNQERFKRLPLKFINNFVYDKFAIVLGIVNVKRQTKTHTYTRTQAHTYTNTYIHTKDIHKTKDVTRYSSQKKLKIIATFFNV